MPARSSPAGSPPAPAPPVRSIDWLALGCGATIAAGTVAAYARTFSVPLVFDDLYTIADNATIRHWSTAWRPPLESTASGRPMLNLSLAFNYAVSGLEVWSYHALNLLIHVLAALTLFGIVRRTILVGQAGGLARAAMPGHRPGPQPTLIAFCIALLWSLHPLQTEAVTYIVQRAESLMGLFYLLTVYCFIRGVETDARLRSLNASYDAANFSPTLRATKNLEVGGHPGGHSFWLLLSVLACLLGMATKEVMASAPLIVLLYDRTFVAGGFRAAWRRRRGFYLALAATWLVLFALVLSTHGRNRTAGFGGDISWWSYALTQLPAIAHYLRLCFWPHPLIFDYGTALAIPSLRLVLSLLVVAGLVALTAWALVRRPAAGFLGAAFFLILAPSSSIVPVATQTMAEHRMYLPLIPVAVLMVLGLFRRLGRAALPLCLVLALGLSAITWRRNGDYRSELSLWSDTASKNPADARAHNALGNIWLKIPGRLDYAIAQYEEALRLDPLNAVIHNDLGYSLRRVPGRRDDAIAQYQEALRLDPNYAEAHYNLGNAWAQTPGRLTDAIVQYQEALRLKPDYAEAHNNLGGAWMALPGRLDDAMAQCREALRLRPDYAEAHFNLAIALLQMPGRTDEARAQLETVLRLHPGDEAARQLLAKIKASPP